MARRLQTMAQKEVKSSRAAEKQMFTKLIVSLMSALMFGVDLAFAAFVYILINEVYDKEYPSQFSQSQEYPNESRFTYQQPIQQHYGEQQPSHPPSGDGLYAPVLVRPSRRYDY